MSTSNTLTKNDLEAVIGKLVSNRDDEIQELLARPYIVEQGTSGDWTYRKWSDGTAECWGTHTRSITLNTIGTYYHRGYITNIAYPTGLFDSSPSVFAQVNDTSMWVGLETNSKTAIQTLYVYSVANDTRDINIAIYAIGKWK